MLPPTPPPDRKRRRVEAKGRSGEEKRRREKRAAPGEEATGRSVGPLLEPIATGIEYFRSRQMSASTSDDDVPRQDLYDDEFVYPGGKLKKIRAKCLKDLNSKDDKCLFKRRREVDLGLATSIKFVNFRANCQPGKVLAKVSKLFKEAKSVKVGKLRPNQKKGLKNEWKYNGWVNFFGIGDCKRAKIRIQKKPEKFGGMIIEKVGRIRNIGLDSRKKFIALPRYRIPAKLNVPTQYSCWGKKLPPRNDSRFAFDDFTCLPFDVVLVYD